MTDIAIVRRRTDRLCADSAVIFRPLSYMYVSGSQLILLMSFTFADC